MNLDHQALLGTCLGMGAVVGYRETEASLAYQSSYHNAWSSALPTSTWLP